MKLRLQLIDVAALGSTLEEFKRGIVSVIQAQIIELRSVFANGLTFNDNMLAAVVEITAADGIVSGAELQRGNPKKFKPIGFFPIQAVNEAGVGLRIADYAFNPKPSSGEGWHGITVTVLSGTIDKVTGILVGG